MIVTVSGYPETYYVNVGVQGPIGPSGTPFRGAVYRTTSGTIDFSGVALGTFINSGLTGTFDTAVAAGTGAATTAGAFGVKRVVEGTAWCYVVGTADVAASQNKRLGVKLAVNGVPIDATECNATVTNQTIAKLHTMYILNLPLGAEVSLWFANYSTQGEITVERARMTLIGIP